MYPHIPRSVGATCCFVILNLAAAHVVADGPIELTTAAEKAEAAVLSKLNEKISFDFQKTPLREVVTFLGNKTGLNLYLDEPRLANINVGVDAPVTLGADGAPLHLALDRLLQQIDHRLMYDVRAEVVVISTWKSPNDRLVTRLYDLRDFFEGEVTLPVASGTVHHVYLDHFQIGALPITDALVEFLQHVTEPDSWAAVGGPGTIRTFRDVLIVTQERAVHEQIAATLTAVRQVRDSQTKQPGGGPVRIGWTQEAIEAEKRFNVAMAKTVSLEFNETRLEDVAEHIGSLMKIPCRLDHKALAEIGVTDNTPITFSIRNVTLRSAVQLMLDPLVATVEGPYRNDASLITARETDCGFLTTTLYPVGDFVAQAVASGEDPHEVIDKTLIEAIVLTIETDSWDDYGGQGSVEYFEPCQALAVSQENRIHERIALLIDGIRKLRRGSKDEAALPAEQGERTEEPFVIAIYHLAPTPDEADHASAEKLPDLIKGIIESGSCSGGQVAAHVYDGRLVVRQNVGVHKKIFKLLRELQLLAPAPGNSMGGGVSGGGFF